jgi:hypothetical protein
MMRAAKVPVRVIGARFGLSKDAVNRHFHMHVSEKRRNELMVGPARVEALAAAAAEESKTVMEFKAVVARSVLFNQFLLAAEANDRRGLVSIADSLLQALRDYAKLTGELRQMAGITINQNTLNLAASQAAKLRLRPEPESTAPPSDSSPTRDRRNLPERGSMSCAPGANLLRLGTCCNSA